MYTFASQTYQPAHPHADYLFELVDRDRRPANYIVGNIGSRGVSIQEARSITRRMMLGLNLRDIAKEHQTRCGYPVRNLEIRITADGITYHGEFQGQEGIWLMRQWRADGIERYIDFTTGKDTLNPAMDLVYVHSFEAEVENVG